MPTPAEDAKALHVLLPTGAATAATVPQAQTYDRRLAISAAFATTSGTMTMTGINLAGGTVVTAITFVSGATAESGGTNLWFALYRADTLALMAQSTNDTGAAAFAANTALRKALTAPQTCPYTGLYYLAYMSTNSAGAQPTLLCVTSAIANNLGSITGMTPILAATSTTGLTSAAPATAGALTTITQCLYGFVD